MIARCATVLRQMDLLRRWALALFAIDLRSLALFRIALAVVLLVDLATRAPFLVTSYTDAGAHPRQVLVDYHERGTLPSLHLLSGAVEVQAALFGIAALAGALLLVGWRTQLATVVCWLLLDSLHERNRLVLLGADPWLRFLLFWSMFLPLGARASLDALRRPPAPRRHVCSVASAALLLQTGCVFWITGMLKTGPAWTSDGTAIYYALNRSWQVRPFGEWLLAHPPLTEWLTPAVLWFERLGPWLLFVPLATAPLRLLTIPAFWALLAGLGLGLRLHLFPWVGAIAMLPFLPALAWDALGRRDAAPYVGGAAEAGPTGATGARLGHAGVQLVVGGLLLLMLWSNAGSVAKRLAPPPALERVTAFLHLRQAWTMYAPAPKPIDAWLAHRGRLRNGNTIDLDRAHGGAGWAAVEAAWPDYRFQAAIQKMAGLQRQKALDAYAAWLCRRWNQDARGGGRLDWVGVDGMFRHVPRPGEPGRAPEVRPLAGVPCPG